MNKLYNPELVCPFRFLFVTSESLYNFLKLSPPLSKAFEVDPIIHLPIILLPSLSVVFVTRQLFKILSGLSHLPDSSCTNNFSFSPSYELSPVFFQSIVVSSPSSASLCSVLVIDFLVSLDAGTLYASSVFGLSIPSCIGLKKNG